jgi:hypothetical protein
MECHRSLGVATLVALMATHRALSAPLIPIRSACGTTASQRAAPPPEAAPAEPPRRSVPARPAAKASA